MFSCLMTFSVGCAYVIVGGLGAVGGYVASPDTVEGIISIKQYEEVWNATVEMVSVMGIINERSDAGGVIDAKINGARVKIKVMRITSTSTKISVKARKTFLPRIKLAQNIYIKIVNYLDDGSLL